VSAEQAEIAWFLYELQPNANRLALTLTKTIYTKFWPALNTITTAQPGNIEDFIEHLQLKLDEKTGGNPPDAPSLTDITLI
jgi:hypothetical protein